MKKSPLFLKTFIYTGILLLLTAFSIGLLSDHFFLQYTENEISKSGIGKLKVSSNITEMIMNTANRNAVKLSLNQGLNRNLIQTIPTLKEMGSWDDMARLMKMQDTLKEIENANAEIQSVYIYLEDIDFVISDIYASDYADDFPDTAWLKQYKSGKNMPYWMNCRIAAGIRPNNDSAYVLTYIFPLTYYTSTVKGAIIVNLFEKQISRQINSTDLEQEGYIFVMSREGNVISHTNKEMLGKNVKNEAYIKNILESKSDEGYVITNITNTRQLATYYKSGFNGWTYVGVFPLNTLMNKVTSLRAGILYALIGILLAGIVIEYIISKRLYNPVKQLIQEISSQKGIDIREEKDEVTILSKAFDAILKQDSQLISILENNRKTLRENYYLNLINGITADINIGEMDGVKFTFPYYFCIIAIIDRYRDFMAAYPEEQQYYLKTLMSGIFEEVLNQNFKCVGLRPENDKLIFIVNTEMADFNENLETLRNSFEVIKKEILKVLDNSVTISIGHLRDQIAGIKTSYCQALDLLKLRLITGHGCMIHYREDHCEEKKYIYPITIEKHIFNNLSAGSQEGVLASISEFIDSIKSNGPSYDYTILMLNQLVGSTVRYLLDSNVSVNEIFGNNFNIYRQLLDNETLDDIGIWLAKIYLEIIEFFKNARSLNTKYFDRAIEYIHQNFRKDIDILALAENLEVSYSQLRRVFLNETGENLVDYINNLRIEEAKRLLKQTDMNIVEIALSLGYYNDRSFSRFFKKYEGITPGEFRKLK